MKKLIGKNIHDKLYSKNSNLNNKRTTYEKN